MHDSCHFLRPEFPHSLGVEEFPLLQSVVVDACGRSRRVRSCSLPFPCSMIFVQVYPELDSSPSRLGAAVRLSGAVICSRHDYQLFPQLGQGWRTFPRHSFVVCAVMRCRQWIHRPPCLGGLFSVLVVIVPSTIRSQGEYELGRHPFCGRLPDDQSARNSLPWDAGANSLVQDFSASSPPACMA